MSHESENPQLMLATLIHDLYLLASHGDYSNGNIGQDPSVDEGRYMAMKAFEYIDQQIREAKLFDPDDCPAHVFPGAVDEGCLFCGQDFRKDAHGT